MKIEIEFDEKNVAIENIKKMYDALLNIESDTLYENESVSNCVKQLYGFLNPMDDIIPNYLKRFINGATKVNEALGIFCECKTDSYNRIKEFHFYDKNDECFESFLFESYINDKKEYTELLTVLTNELKELMECKNYDDLNNFFKEHYNGLPITKEEHRLRVDEFSSYFEFECGCWRVEY